LLALSFLLDRHGTVDPEPIPDADVRALGYRARAAFERLLRDKYAAVHRMPDGEVWWTLTHKGLRALSVRAMVSSSPSVGKYLRELAQAGM